MKKIISLFKRDYEGSRFVTDDIVPGAEWVLAGDGQATRKYDGTCCMFRGGKLYKRYEVKKGKNPPKDFEPATDVDPITGKQQGWLPVGEGPEDQYHREAWGRLSSSTVEDGTCELVGPKIQGNPEGYDSHTLLRHGATILDDVPRDYRGLSVRLIYKGLSGYFVDHDIEGIVWHHPDGRMVKIKGKDFGVRRDKS